MKKMGCLCLILCAILVLQCLAAPVAAAELEAPAEDSTQTAAETAADAAVSDASVTNGCRTLNAQMPLLGNAQLVDNTGSAILYEVNSGTLVYAWNPDARMYPASLVKIMTALLAMEYGNLDETVTVSKSAIDSTPKTTVSSNLQEGEEISLRDLLYCMLVASANDAASVIADHIGGSQEAFVAAMNQRAEELGCTGTHFVNAHGLHDEQQYTTARDVAKILLEAVQYDDFREIFGTTSYTVPATNLSEARDLATGNYLMSQRVIQIYYDSRVTGGRTGVADDGGRCLAATAEKNGMNYITVVMGSKSVYNEDKTVKSYGSFRETSALLNLGYGGMDISQILYENQAMTQYSVANGANNVVVGPQQSISSVLPTSVTTEDITWRYQDTAGALTAPIEKGQKITIAQAWYNNICIAQAELVAMNAVQIAAGTFVQPVDAQTSGNGLRTGLIVLGVLVALIAGAFLGSYILRAVQKAKVRSRRRRRRKDRRRSR